tara:strand:- start:2031 stop:3746 length:1716 start_codon:yes stop_codon:yes gene_type:complete
MIKKLFDIIPKGQKKNTIIFFIMLITSMILEALSLGLIFPVIMIFLSENYSYENFLVLENLSKNYSDNQILIWLVISIVFLYFLKNIFLFFLHVWKHSFANNMSFLIQKKLFSRYLFEPYLNIIKENSALKIRNLQMEASKFSKCLGAYMITIIEVMISISLIFILFFFDPRLSSLIILIPLIMIIGFYLFAKLKTVNWSKEKIFHNGKAIKVLMECLSAMKEIKIFKKENIFLEKYTYHEKRNLRLITFFNIFNDSPKILIELVSIVAICAGIYFMIISGYQKGEIIASLGLVTGAAFRIIPSTTRIINSLNAIKINSPSIDLLHAELNDKNSIKNISSENLIKNNEFKKNIFFKNVSFGYVGKQKLFSKLSFELNKKDKIFLFGESGSGKSTFIGLLIGLIKPIEGKVEIDGQNIYEKFDNLDKIFAYISQENFLLDDTISYNITLSDKNKVDIQKFIKALKVSNLYNFVSDLPDKENTVIGENAAFISGGQRQRLAIARAIYYDAEILILDEATSEIDSDTEKKILANVFREYEDRTLIIISHNKSNVKNCKKYFKIENQGIIEIKSI